MVDGRLTEVNPELLQSIAQLLKPSYVSTDAILQREEEHCKKTYYIKNKDYKLIGFFMVNWEDLNDKPSVYLGLSAVDKDYKSSGLISLVYLKFIEDALRFEREQSKQLILYGTTVVPNVFKTIHMLFRNVSPRKDGSYSERASKLAAAYRRQSELSESKNPFVFKGVAADTQYSDMEKQRLKAMVEKHNFRLFEKLNILEEQGDRLLMIMYLPAEEDFETICKMMQDRIKKISEKASGVPMKLKDNTVESLTNYDPA